MMADAKTESTTVVADATRVSVKFEKAWGLYNKGEIAGFNSDKAQWLIDKKIAVKA